MRTSGRGNRDSYRQTVLGTTGINNYWSFDSGYPQTLFGAVNLTGTNYPVFTQRGKISRYSATFDGNNDCLYSSTGIDLSATNKMTAVFWWYPNVYDLANNAVLFEIGSNPTIIAGGVSLNITASAANDPIYAYIRGNTNNYKTYNKTGNFTEKEWMHIVFVADFGASLDSEVQLYKNGTLLIPSTTALGENVVNFGNNVLYIGARNNASMFANHTIDDFVLFNTALTQAQITKIYESSFY